MRVLVCLAALLVIVAAIEDVEELEDHAADPYNDGSGIPYANPVGGTGYFPHGMNFPGPKYGLPGYKESHDWEGDFDIMSPLVFDYRMYGALINAPLKDKPFNEEDLKVHWTNQVFSAPTGGCPQGNLWFNANRFKSIHGSAFTEFTMQTVTCDVILKVFLTKAVYEGYQVFSVPTTGARASPYPTMGAKLFEGTGGHTSSGDFAEGALASSPSSTRSTTPATSTSTRSASSPRTPPSSRRWPRRSSSTAASPCSRSLGSWRRNSWTASRSSSTTSASKAEATFQQFDLHKIDREPSKSRQRATFQQFDLHKI